MLALSCVTCGATPSENKGRRGTYVVKTAKEGYNYYVCVPKSYSDENPAGIHLHFHGQSSQGTAPGFDVWAKYFLEPYNLIGINMQYMDGNNQIDTAGKVEAAIEAIMQVSADYKIIHGRGVICSFSGGGLPHTLMAEKYGKADVKAGTWPFNHSAGYDSNLHFPLRDLSTMSWFFGLGSEEWKLARLGPDLTSRAQELFADAAGIRPADLHIRTPKGKGRPMGEDARGEISPGRSPDIFIKITKGKGHEMTDDDRAESARLFRRSDLALCAFLYEPDFAGTELDAIVKKANRLELGGAATDVKRLLAGAAVKPETRKNAEYVRDRIEKRVEAVFELSKELAADDPLLWGYYGKIFAKQLTAHPRAAEFKKIVAAKDKKFDPDWALGVFAKTLGGLFAGGPTLSPGAEDVLRKVQTAAGEKSSLGRMAAQFLELK